MKWRWFARKDVWSCKYLPCRVSSEANGGKVVVELNWCVFMRWGVWLLKTLNWVSDCPLSFEWQFTDHSRADAKWIIGVCDWLLNIHTVSHKLTLLWLAISLVHINRFQQFFSRMMVCLYGQCRRRQVLNECCVITLFSYVNKTDFISAKLTQHQFRWNKVGYSQFVVNSRLCKNWVRKARVRHLPPPHPRHSSLSHVTCVCMSCRPSVVSINSLPQIRLVFIRFLYFL